MSTWCPFATRVNGAVGKQNAATRAGKGAVLHSMEGYLNHALDEVKNPAIPLSWHFSVGYDGSLFQHYPIEAQCWHAHAAGNVNYVGIEHEGVVGEPETDEQVATDIRVLAWLAEADNWIGITRDLPERTIWEHNEVPGNPTACPSGRIRWGDILAGLAPAPDPVIDGIGVVTSSGRDLGNILPPLEEGETVAGVGAHLTDGSEPTLWPK